MESPPLRSLVLVAAGGAVGAVARVGLATAFPADEAGYPWSTFVENLTGVFALAFVLTLLAARGALGGGVHLFLGTGALGAFTTYSALADEIVERLLADHLLLAGGYATATLVGGLVAALAGAAVARASPWASPRSEASR